MEGFYIERQNKSLTKNLHMLVYGSPDAIPVLLFPDETGYCSSANTNGLIDGIAPLIESDRVQILCCEGLDKETLLNGSGDKSWRSARQEAYYHAVADEFVPLVSSFNHSGMKIIAAGCGVGATQAMTMFLRHPDFFSGVIALGGNYDLKTYFDGWCDDNLYKNSPCDFMRNITRRHKYFTIYPDCSIFISSGRNEANQPALSTMMELEYILNSKKINNAHFEYWGYDVTPDYYWYTKMMQCYLPIALEQQYEKGTKLDLGA
ncbi:MAG: hypothetical protein K6G51_06130 [Sphaerochaetaceae bacterium]|nr:hypothetical protein [Sphaerochaetaceae bacterium]